ncbi:uncharacterized protein CEXT_553811 [Caerostris extrusa]|uniref:Uncharacterized protein n=1 Tax=Caerostris extrusa TaxID=172846 RepID=A0AAV4W418_CAEEX|nr:uncharacterized protein CEXT_553811 [Caerostris extrusa]
MDMTSFYERRPRSSGVAVLDKLILWRPPLHDYHQEELISIQRDIDSVNSMLNEMLDFMPQEAGGDSRERRSAYWDLVDMDTEPGIQHENLWKTVSINGEDDESVHCTESVDTGIASAGRLHLVKKANKI